jgi:hypothetical protein
VGHAERGIKLPPSAWDAPGWTWDEFVAAAPRADQSGVWPVGWDTAAGVPNLLQVLLCCNNNGGAVFSEEAGAQQSRLGLCTMGWP